MFGHDERHVFVAHCRQLSDGVIELGDQATITRNVFGIQQLAGWRILHTVAYK